MEALTEEELAVVKRLEKKIQKRRKRYTELDQYREGTQRLQHIGLAVPPNLRQFETVINVPRMAVEEVKRRMEVRALITSEGESDDKDLRSIWNRSNLDSQLPLLIDDALTYGIGYVSISADDSGRARLVVEHAPDVAVERDLRSQRVSSALRVYVEDAKKGKASLATLYLPDRTLLLAKEKGDWQVEEQRPHSLGAVPIVPLVNRARTGSHRADGVTEMADVIGMTDAIARIVMDMQVAVETAAIPQKFAAGIDAGDFVDPKTGMQRTRWESYFMSVWATDNPQAKFGTFDAADISQFTKAVDRMLVWCAVTLGLPTRYAGNDTSNPATEGSIRADEARLVKNCESKGVMWGDEIALMMGMASAIEHSQPLGDVNIRVEWHDPSTPTLAQRADALQKLAGGKSILSVQGVWDELGWSEPRKTKEREYLQQEATDPEWLEISAKTDAIGE